MTTTWIQKPYSPTEYDSGRRMTTTWIQKPHSSTEYDSGWYFLGMDTWTPHYCRHSGSPGNEHEIPFHDLHTFAVAARCM